METKGIDLVVMDRLLEIGGQMSELKERPGGGYFAVVPQGFKLESIPDADHEPAVTRRTPKFFETQSFVAYVNNFKREGSTRIFVNPENLKAEAVIDYDTADLADRGVHRACLQLGLSPQWVAWTAAVALTKQRGFTQEDFAEFLEEHGVDVETPTAAELMELVTKMNITRQVSYKRGIHLQDGRQQFSYVNENQGGTVEFPGKMTLGIPVFTGGQRYRVPVLLRYRLQDGGSLRFALVIHRHEEILKDAIQGDIAAIQEATGVPVHIGSVG